MTNETSWRARDAAGVLLLSAAFLFFELYALRWFTLSQWHHFGALVVSLALFGSAAAGVLLAMSRTLQQADSRAVASWCAAATALTGWLGLHAASWITFRPVRSAVAWEDIGAVAAWYGCFGLPLFFASLGIFHFFLDRRRPVGAIYACNLLGGALGALLGLTLSWLLSGWEALAVMGLAACAWALFQTPNPGKLLAATVVLVLAAVIRPIVPLSEYKSLAVLPTTIDAEVAYARWSPSQHLALVRAPTFRHAPGLALSYRGAVPSGLTLLVNGDRPDVLLQPPVEADLLRSLPGAVAHELSPEGKVLLLDVGGNLPVLQANAYGRESLVQMSPEVAALWFEERGLARASYFPGAELVTQSPRVLLREQKEASLALVELVLRDSQATMTAALGQPAEGYLFTVEAWEELLRLLAPEGLFCLTRWRESPPRESLRMVDTAVEALKRVAPDLPPGQGLVVFRSLMTLTLLVRPAGFGPSELARVREALQPRGYRLVVPGESGAEHGEVITALLDHPLEFHRKYMFEVRAATDDRPFPWFFLKPTRLGELRRKVGIGWRPLLDGGFLLGAALAQAAVFGVLLILLPFLRRRARPPVRSALLPGLYFLLIGLAFFFVELPLAQVLIRAAPSASHAFGLVICGMLLGAGAGAQVSERMSLRAIRWALVGVVLVLGAEAMLLSGAASLLLCSSAAWWSGAVFCAIPAFGMGMAMPAGLRWVTGLGAWGRSWAWAVNGCASVVSPLLASVLALGVGFRVVLAGAALLYLLAGLLLPRTSSA